MSGMDLIFTIKQIEDFAKKEGAKFIDPKNERFTEGWKYIDDPKMPGMFELLLASLPSSDALVRIQEMAAELFADTAEHTSIVIDCLDFEEE